ncbi:conserved membrane hypothetical protein [Bosea sp. 62]|uniref:hypothetical protein n=1 Tax=unclassified Bosea (in: a-proteobacteria) TaxID=2653178 RepID=UPI001258DEB2|nr:MULTISPECIES: hypothetical protein [unclassified Bosea (in: a-proteobacteria)]CAD5256440.1 conserved membrane hypothetical protein [Bosea sp. 7B]CAD5274105.1 conserved membrane hypothetical protein [Bosea sp. 21B]CAD5284031.1 conserved membrane hypothetical protein [Bosea sp. 46]VVT60134.1 conserved membrane hypothetical protein [Bosea sp. EC-HK365B]VXB56669.1 conserved membrane hypothetical protein [Bosea sp. 62]
MNGGFANPALVADSIVDICGALGLAVAMLTLRRRDPRGALTTRFLLAMGLVAALFLLRGLGWWSGSVLLERLALSCAALFPLGALIVTEGMLRRHAPRVGKIAVLAGSGLLVLGSLIGLADHPWAYDLALAGFQFVTVAFCGLLLFRRDPASLTEAENTSVWRLGLCAFLILPFALSDFRGLLPDMPVRLGGVGALLLVSIVLVTGGAAPTRRQGFVLLGLRVAAALLLGAAAAHVTPGADLAHGVRLCAVTLAGVLAIALAVDALSSSFDATAPGVLGSLARSRAETRETLIAQLAGHPLFSSARRLGEAELGDYDPAVLKPALREISVLHASGRSWPWPSTEPAAERLAALMAAHSVSHLLVLGEEPLDLLLVTVPVVSDDPATETALALVRRLLASAPSKVPA